MGWGTPPPLVELEPLDSPSHPLAPWFGTWRRDRRAARRSTRRRAHKRAIVTMVHNESIFLPLWLRYYSQWFGAKDIYVLDHETTDGSTAGQGFVRIPVEHPTIDATWTRDTITDLQHDLLGRYELTLVCDVDEIVAPLPSFGTLGEYLDRFDEEWVNCLGYELIHMRDRESPLRLDRPVLDQRGWWYFNDGYDKASIATVPMRWRPGFHGREDFGFAPDPDLRLIHLHRMDYEVCHQRHLTRANRRYAEEDAAKGWAAHNMIAADDAAFEHWFYNDSGLPGIEVDPEPIAAEWRGAF